MFSLFTTFHKVSNCVSSAHSLAIIVFRYFFIHCTIRLVPILDSFFFIVHHHFHFLAFHTYDFLVHSMNIYYTLLKLFIPTLPTQIHERSHSAHAVVEIESSSTIFCNHIRNLKTLYTFNIVRGYWCLVFFAQSLLGLSRSNLLGTGAGCVLSHHFVKSRVSILSSPFFLV